MFAVGVDVLFPSISGRVKGICRNVIYDNLGSVIADTELLFLDIGGTGFDRAVILVTMSITVFHIATDPTRHSPYPDRWR
jgi:uncharacterized protein YprB with RNaseH-like and TPR domain